MNMTELLKKDQYVYRCDECKHTFKAVEIKLVDPADNFTVLTPGYTMLCVEKDGTVCSKQNPRKTAGDKSLACPKCGRIHPNGFDLK